MYRSTSIVASLAGLLVAGSAYASTWQNFEASFPAFPCSDGWMACLVGDVRVTPELQRGTSGMLNPANARIDWDTLEPTAVFSPFVGLSAYTGEAPRADEVITEAAPAEPVAEPAADNGGDAVADAGSAGDPQPPRSNGSNRGSNGSSGSTGSDPAPSGDPAAPADNGMVRPPASLNPNGTPPAGDSLVRPTNPPPPGNDAVAVVDPGPANTAGSDSCDNLQMLEPSAMLGKLTPGQIACLEASLAATGTQTEKDKLSRVLMANAWAAGDKKTWETLVKRHLDEIDQSDPDLCYKYAMYLSKKGPDRAEGVIRWSEKALENKTRWTGDTYKDRVYNLLKLKAAAAQEAWKAAEEKNAAAPSDANADAVEKLRNRTKTLAREWYEYAKESGKDTTKALQLCITAAGTSEFCEG